MAKRRKQDEDFEVEMNAEMEAEAASAPVEEAKEEEKAPEAKASYAPTFSEAQGSEANQHAKALAKAEAAKKAEAAQVKHPTLYSVKKDKVVKLVVKEDKVIQSYIGNMVRNKAQLEASIANWKKQGVWIEPHQVEEAYRQIREKLKAKA